MIVFHDTGGQGTSKWLRLRQGLWTGSKAIRLLQMKPMLADSDWGGNKYTKRGYVLETIAIKEYERRYKRLVTRPDFITNTAYPNAGYSPDGIDRKILLEVKAFNNERHDKLVSGNIPLEVLAQIHFGMVITGLRRARLIAINPEREVQVTIIDIYYDKWIGGNIRKKLRLGMKNRLASSGGA